MSALYVLLFASLAVAGGFLAAYLWSVRKGQFDDVVTPSVRILFDEESPGTGAGPAARTPEDDAAPRIIT